MAMALPRSSKNAMVGISLAAFALTMAALPFFLSKWKSEPIIDASKPLSRSAIMRGPYVNSGSRDVGPDPKRGTYN